MASSSQSESQGPGTGLSGSTRDQGSNTNGDFELLWGLRKYLVLLGVLAVGVTYNAGLTPPGDFWTLNKDGHHAGDPILRDAFSGRYKVFFYCNAAAFAASLVLIILLLSKRVTRQKIWLRSMQLTMILDLFSLLGAYAAGSCRAVKSSIYIWILVFAIFLYIGIHILVSTKVIPQTLTMRLQTILHGILTRLGVRDSQVSSHIKEDVEEAHKFILMLVTFAATITYQAGLNPPGGFWAENEHGSSIHLALPPYKHHPATSVLRSNYLRRYNAFISFNSTSFVASLVIIILLLSPKLSGHGIRTNAMIVCVVADLVCLVAAYAAGCCREVATSFYVVFIIIIVLASFAILAAFFGHSPVESLLKRVRSRCLRCLSKVCRALSLNNRSRNVDSAEQSILTEDDNRQNQTEIGGGNIHLAHLENGHTDSIQAVPTQNTHDIQTEKHLKKTRTYLLLLAILAVSLAYQSGLNPPGGFWSRSEHHHSAADRILEDIYHPRFIAFFYLNAVAFVASIIIIMMLLNKKMSEMVTKRRVLPGMMIVVLLSLTAAFAMGNCREAKKKNFILVFVWIVLAYVLLHVLIATHVIPGDWRGQVAEKLKCLPVYHCWPVPSQPCHENPEDDTSEKELEQRRSLLLTLAILAVTVTYQAGMNPPGGVWSDDKDVTGTPGNPILQDTHPKRYDVFYYSNSVSFVSSVVVTILLVNKESFEHGIKSYALRVCLVVGLLGLLIAYVAGSCRNTKQAIHLSIIAMAVLVSLLIQVLLSLAIGKPLGRFIGFLQSLLFSSTDDGQNTATSGSTEVSDREKIVRKRHKYLMLLAILAASIAYQAGLNPPGGFWSDDEGHVAGNPVLHDINHLRYKIFFCFNSFAFMASIVVIMLLLSKSARKKDVPLEVLHLIMILDLLALMTAFAAGSCRHLRTSVYVYGLVAGFVVYLVLVIVLLSGIAKYLKKLERSGLFSCSWRRLERSSTTNTAAILEPGPRV
uniref:Uncharacterized protein n=1 Tax=Avena sativa TaxID=4498 RepID=A0ACD5ZU33_AVESA